MKQRGCPNCGETRTTDATDNHGQTYRAYACACRIVDTHAQPVPAKPCAECGGSGRVFESSCTTAPCEICLGTGKAG